jgi:osmoprotectant transport system ATP-binding protein
LIRLEEVTKYYGPTLAVDALSLEVRDGEVCVLIGPSGCGKTSTLRMINRLIEPTSGRILIGERDTARLNPEELRRTIGYAIQGVGLFPHMTVARNVGVVPELLHWDRPRVDERVRQMLELVGLPPAEYGAKYPLQLSGGQAQRVGVARALAADPPILLMDEPFGAVDPLTRERLQTQFARIQQKLRKTVILVTHDLDEAIRLADRIAVMEGGRLMQYDTPENILQHPAGKFVHDFVGTDRALKRLSRISVRDFIKPAPTVSLGATAEEAAGACGGCNWLWVLDADSRLVGWLDRGMLGGPASAEEAVVRAGAEQIALSDSATLREALSRMLEQGFSHMPVVDENGKFLGEVRLSDIERETSGGGTAASETQ